jgi:hypothetical protein
MDINMYQILVSPLRASVEYGSRLILYIWVTEYPYILSGSHSCVL